MAITSSGIGSNLDVDGIVSQLMTLERKPLTTLDTREAGIQAKISALGSLKGAISSVQTAASNMVPTSGTTAFQKFNTYQSSVADASIAMVTTDSKAVAGSYKLEITQLAQEHRMVSRAGVDSPFNEDGKLKGSGGTLTIGLGEAGKTPGKTSTISVAEGATAEEIRDAINAAKAGVSATVISGKDGKRLALVGDAAGSDQSITLTTSGGMNLAMDDTQSATGSAFKLNGIEVTGTTNTVSTAIDGMTLTLLKKTEEGKGTTISVTNDTSSLSSTIDSFVKAYNDFNRQASSLGSYDQKTKVAGTLNGDSGLRMAQNVLRDAINKAPQEVADGRFKRLSDIGIETQKDGSLQINRDKLNKAVKDDIEGVANLVAATGASFKTATTSLIGSEGAITAKTEGYNSSIKSISKQREALNARMVTIEARYRKQFTALDTTMSKMTQTSNFLTAELNKISKTNSK